MVVRRFVPNFVLICFGAFLASIFIAIARSAYMYDPVGVNALTRLGIETMELAVLGALVVVFPVAWGHIRVAFEQVVKGGAGSYLSIPRVLFGIFVAGFLGMVAFAFWRRAFDKMLMYIYPTIDPAPAGYITSLIAFTLLYLCLWWIHAICRGVNSPNAHSWRVEHVKMVVILVASFLLTLFGV